jgi:hypothetical protein
MSKIFLEIRTGCHKRNIQIARWRKFARAVDTTGSADAFWIVLLFRQTFAVRLVVQNKNVNRTNEGFLSKIKSHFRLSVSRSAFQNRQQRGETAVSAPTGNSQRRRETIGDAFSGPNQ